MGRTYFLLGALLFCWLLKQPPVAAQQTLLTIEPTAEQPRNSEGDIIELQDGRLCLIYTRFTGGTGDHAAADLAKRVSRDGGQSWSDDELIVRHEGAANVMSVSLLRLTDGRIALFYLRKQSLEDCRPVMRISTDDTATFGPPQMCIEDEVGYYVLNNDRAVQLKNGRLVLPVAIHNKPAGRIRTGPAEPCATCPTTLARRGGEATPRSSPACPPATASSRRNQVWSS